jgi:hypothetical protein
VLGGSGPMSIDAFIREASLRKASRHGVSL